LHISRIFRIIAFWINKLTFTDLNTQEFIKRLAERLDVSQKDAAGFLEDATKVIRETISEEKKITLQHLGSFQVKKSASRSSYIPALNKKAVVPPRRIVQFHVAETLKEKIKNVNRP
jgi:DNA-binding protein HU-beta